MLQCSISRSQITSTVLLTLVNIQRFCAYLLCEISVCAISPPPHQTAFLTWLKNRLHNKCQQFFLVTFTAVLDSSVHYCYFFRLVHLQSSHKLHFVLKFMIRPQSTSIFSVHIFCACVSLPWPRSVEEQPFPPSYFLFIRFLYIGNTLTSIRSPHPRTSLLFFILFCLPWKYAFFVRNNICMISF